LIDSAGELAKKHKVSERTIHRDAKFARAVDAIAEAAGPDARRAILARGTKLSHQDVLKLGEVAKSQPKVPYGLGYSSQMIESFVRDDGECLEMLRQAVKGKWGRPSKNGEKPYNVSLNYGNSASYTLELLKKRRPDLHAKVLAGELSAHRAALEAGFRRKTASIRIDSCEHAVRSLLRFFTRQQITAALKATSLTFPVYTD
jgi:hypothetical protein